jgi:hypothetical protein
MIKISDAELIDAYCELKSTYKVAEKFGLTRHAVKRELKRLNVLRTQSDAAQQRENNNIGKYVRTEEHKAKLSENAKARTGDKNPFFGKKHTVEVRKKLSTSAKQRYGEKNPNYKDGKYLRRPRDFKIHEMQPLRNFVFHRDKFTCHYCQTKGGHLHAHHILPYWICNDAFLDSENLITVCSKCHFEKAHCGDWQKFDLDLITDRLKKKYHIPRERLNELASLWKKR